MKAEIKTIKFTIPLNPVTKKNSMVRTKWGLAQSKAYRDYEKKALAYLPTGFYFDEPVNVQAWYFVNKRQNYDINNLHSALHDIIVKGGLLEDDNCRRIVSTDGSRVYVDARYPRTEIVIEPWYARVQRGEIMNPCLYGDLFLLSSQEYKPFKQQYERQMKAIDKERKLIFG